MGSSREALDLLLQVSHGKQVLGALTLSLLRYTSRRYHLVHLERIDVGSMSLKVPKVVLATPRSFQSVWS